MARHGQIHPNVIEPDVLKTNLKFIEQNLPPTKHLPIVIKDIIDIFDFVSLT